MWHSGGRARTTGIADDGVGTSATTLLTRWGASPLLSLCLFERASENVDDAIGVFPCVQPMHVPPELSAPPNACLAHNGPVYIVYTCPHTVELVML